MDIDRYAAAHPLGYVHIAYAVVIVLHFGYGLWIAREWFRVRANADKRVSADADKKATRPLV
jgi:hypothetical protein